MFFFLEGLNFEGPERFFLGSTLACELVPVCTEGSLGATVFCAGAGESEDADAITSPVFSPGAAAGEVGLGSGSGIGVGILTWGVLLKHVSTSR